MSIIKIKRMVLLLNIYSSKSHNKATANNKDRIVKYLNFIINKISSDSDIKQLILTDTKLNNLLNSLFEEYDKIVHSPPYSQSTIYDEIINLKE